MNRPYVIPRNQQLLSTKKINQWYEKNQILLDFLINRIDSFFIDNQFIRHPNIREIIQQFIIQQSS